jgi:hypothetical protein
MEDPGNTPKKPRPVMNGSKTGVPFGKQPQPSSAAKKKGWEEFRKQRHLTQSIIKELIGEDGKPSAAFKSYIKSLITNAKNGNPKAIDTVNRCIEDDIIKVTGENTGESFNLTLNLGGS